MNISYIVAEEGEGSGGICSSEVPLSCVGGDQCIRHLRLILYKNIHLLVALCSLYLHSTESCDIA